jgi:hypothetical protein
MREFVENRGNCYRKRLQKLESTSLHIVEAVYNDKIVVDDILN